MSDFNFDNLKEKFDKSISNETRESLIKFFFDKWLDAKLNVSESDYNEYCARIAYPDLDSRVYNPSYIGTIKMFCSGVDDRYVTIVYVEKWSEKNKNYKCHELNTGKEKWLYDLKEFNFEEYFEKHLVMQVEEHKIPHDYHINNLFKYWQNRKRNESTEK